ncbi:MAG TPA: hypothetical protein VKB80_15725 [Kofleriaceae bacterium]|nr:hypothetical protein [Kofleriaceae bacterium]
MLRPAAAVVLAAAAAAASACHSYSSDAAASELLAIALHTADDVASTDCDLPRTSFEPSAGTAGVSGARLTAVALVYRKEYPRRPHSVIGTVRASVARDSPCLTDLVAEIRGRAAAEGCDGVVVGDETSTAERRTALEGACLTFSR